MSFHRDTIWKSLLQNTVENSTCRSHSFSVTSWYWTELVASAFLSLLCFFWHMFYNGPFCCLFDRLLLFYVGVGVWELWLERNWAVMIELTVVGLLQCDVGDLFSIFFHFRRLLILHYPLHNPAWMSEIFWIFLSTDSNFGGWRGKTASCGQ